MMISNHSKITISLFIIALTFFSCEKKNVQPKSSVTVTGANQAVNALSIYNGNLVIAGGFTSVDNLNSDYIAQWNGATWSGISSAGIGYLGSYGGALLSVGTYNGNLLLGGVGEVMQWNGSSWPLLGSGWDSYGGNEAINAMTVYNGNLVVGGYFDFGNNTEDLIMWNGTSWSALGRNIHGSSVNALIVYNGNLIIAGSFDSVGGVAAKNIAQWNGTSWSALGTGVAGLGYLFVNALTVYNGNLIIGGVFDSAGGIVAKNIAQWNGSNWSALGTGLWGVTSLVVYNGDLIAGMGFNELRNPVLLDNACNVEQWNGSAWISLGTFNYNNNPPLVRVSPYVSSVLVYNGKLIACGLFNAIGSMPVNNIAQWNGSSWSGL